MSILLAAASSDPTADAVSTLIRYGLAGVMLFWTLSGKLIVPRYIYDRERNRADKIESKLDELTATMQAQVIPALVQSTDALKQTTEIITENETRRRFEDWRRDPPKP